MCGASDAYCDVPSRYKRAQKSPFVFFSTMLIALETKGSAFKPLLNKPPITWRLKKFKEHHQGRRPSRTESETTLVDARAPKVPEMKEVLKEESVDPQASGLFKFV